ncbi:hypothetical protein [Eleftheria terrae]|uniref:hypothetical protein n=1 Tax=Eleftheria terrae TaxID=1597781 RepID=UPI00263B90B7|nr:hypothetical protein [Eleftheria terrae]WKB52299.1 hypothetical protein N7L95_21285 [Eleftheria terrae]
MARIDWIEHRLLNWARWRLTRGSAGLGYGTSVLASLAMLGGGRSEYREAIIPITDCDAAEMDDAVKLLPSELKAAVLEYYLGEGGMRAKAARLCCTEKTVHNRVDQAQRRLADHFTARKDRAARERRRVEGVQQAARPSE